MTPHSIDEILHKTPLEETRLLGSLGLGTISHPHLGAVLDDVKRSIRLSRRDGYLTLTLGLSRVGKGALGREIVRHLVTTYPELAIPVIVTALTETKSSSGFSATGFFSMILERLGDPAPDRHQVTTTRVPADLHLLRTMSKTAWEKVYAIKGYLLRSRRPLIIDEAGYLAGGTDRDREAMMRSLTWLAHEAQVPVVLLGTLEGLKLLSPREDVNLRIRFFLLRRYRDSKKERALFYAALENFDVELAAAGLLAPGFRLTSDPRFIYAVSHGRFGLVFALVDTAVDEARQHGRGISLVDLRDARRFVMADALGLGTEALADEKMALRILKSTASAGDRPRARVDKTPPANVVDLPQQMRVGERKTVRDPAFGAVKLRARSA